MVAVGNFDVVYYLTNLLQSETEYRPTTGNNTYKWINKLHNYEVMVISRLIIWAETEYFQRK
jgi:hypothetical protein